MSHGPVDSIRIRPIAARDLEQIVRYLDQVSETAGDSFLDEFQTTTVKLAHMPGMGPRRAVRGRLKGLRSWPLDFGQYIVFYMPLVDGGIEIVRVLHGARNINRELRRS